MQVSGELIASVCHLSRAPDSQSGGSLMTEARIHGLVTLKHPAKTSQPTKSLQGNSSWPVEHHTMHVATE